MMLRIENRNPLRRQLLADVLPKAARLLAVFIVAAQCTVATVSGEDPGEIIAIVSSKTGAYGQALSAFQQAIGHKVPVFSAGETVDFPPELRVAVLFGAKASQQQYPPGIQKVQCMTPVNQMSDDRRTSFVNVLPTPEGVLSAMLEVQPALKTVTVLWTSKLLDGYCDDFIRAGAARGVSVVLVRVPRQEELPQRLRSITGAVDALWLLPDPALVNSENFAIVRDYALGRKIPFYAPSEGLVPLGAFAAVASSFEASGKAAAKEALNMLGGGRARTSYPEEIGITVNTTIAQKIGYRLPDTADAKGWKTVQ